MPSELARRAVGPIRGTPHPYGLFSVAAEIIDVTDRHELLGVDWPSEGCGIAYATDWCPPGGEAIPDKTFNRFEWDSAPPVGIYHAVECSTVGFTDEDARRASREGFRLGEQRALEQWFQAEILAPQSVDVTPASGPVTVAQTVGVLEGLLAETYGGLGILHVPVGVSAMLAQATQYAPEGPGRRSWVGNRFALGAGYQANIGPGGEAPEGQAWMYATGPIVIRRGPEDTLAPVEGGAVDTTDNNRYVLTERISVVQVACVVLAALALVTCEC